MIISITPFTSESDYVQHCDILSLRPFYYYHSLDFANGRKQFSTRTQLGLASASLALLTLITDVFSFTLGRRFPSISLFAGDQGDDMFANS
jgi:hypothetical protein